MTIRAVRKKHSHAVADAKKTEKRKQAEERQKQRKLRSNAEQLAILDKGDYVAKKERTRLSPRL